MQVRPSTKTQRAPLRMRQTVCAVLAAVAVAAALPFAVGGQARLVTTERFVPHMSTVPANEGERVGLYLREKATAAAADRGDRDRTAS